jgi:ribosomal protein L7/L12
MTTLLAGMDFKDLAIGAAIGAVIAIIAGGTASSKSDVNAQLLALQVRDLQKKLDALLKHQGVEMPPPPASGLSPELERLASLPDTKIAAIKLYRQENPGASLREAKEKIEAFYKSRQ